MTIPFELMLCIVVFGLDFGFLIAIWIFMERGKR